MVLQLRILSKNFNPHSHERSDNICDLHDDVLDISIHTPTKGATLVNALRAGFKKFQSTLPRRERLSGVGKTTINDIISIHTPTKGATLDCNLSVSLNKFQSTLPQRERPCCMLQRSC